MSAFDETDETETDETELLPAFLDTVGDEAYVWACPAGHVHLETYESDGVCDHGDEHWVSTELAFAPDAARRLAAALLNASDETIAE